MAKTELESSSVFKMHMRACNYQKNGKNKDMINLFWRGVVDLAVSHPANDAKTFRSIAISKCLKCGKSLSKRTK